MKMTRAELINAAKNVNYIQTFERRGQQRSIQVTKKALIEMLRLEICWNDDNDVLWFHVKVSDGELWISNNSWVSQSIDDEIAVEARR